MTLFERDSHPGRSFGPRSRHVATLVLGCLLLVPGIGLLLGGGGLALTYAVGRDDAGYFSSEVSGVRTAGAAVVDRDLPVAVDPGVPLWLLDAVDARVRLEVTASPAGRPLFVGIGPVADVDRYLATVAHDEVVRVTGGGALVYRTRPGGTVAADPASQRFWAATAIGPGTQALTWPVTRGSWAVVVMNADGTSGVASDTASAGIRSGLVLPLAGGLLGLGALLTTVAALAIVRGAAGRQPSRGPEHLLLTDDPAAPEIDLRAPHVSESRR